MADVIANAPSLQNQFRDGQATGAVVLNEIRNFVVSVLSISTAISAAGTTQAGATVLSAAINVIGTVAANSGVSVPLGLRMLVMNRGANALSVYPASTGKIESLAVNVAYSLQPGQDVFITFDPVTTTQAYATLMTNFSTLGTTLPTVSGVLWNNNGVVSIS